ncbi:MAG TPA: DUF2520 domain-containing protein [Burkholderiaceae bacterium]|jgi:predicted short-subunit dehydrogenase-like oxidoreductase (DUF2520 family)
MHTRIALIGAGRLGQSLALALAAAGRPPVAVASRSLAHAQALAARLPGCRAMTLDEAVSEAVIEAELVLLTVPDDAIEAVAASLPWRVGQAAVHCSGATELSALDAAADRGAAVGGFHPLQIFSDPERAADLIAGSSVVIEAEAPLRQSLLDLAALLAMRPMTLPPGGRAAYHAAANFSASFLLSMLDEAVQIWTRIGLPPEQALQALLPLAQGTLESAANRGLPGALSGALSRGDVGVVQRHLQALDALGPEHGGFYRELSRRQLSLAQASGRLDNETLRRLEAVLGN